MKTKNEEAFQAAMKKTWLEWHKDVDPSLILPRPTIQWEKASRGIWEIVEGLQARLEEAESVNRIISLELASNKPGSDIKQFGID